MRYRPSFFFATALLSAGLFVLVVVQWVLSYSAPWASGWHAVQESSPTTFINDSYTVQGHKGQFWFGRCRVTLISFWKSFEEGFPEKLEQLSHHLDVFTCDGEVSPIRGYGWVSAKVIPVRNIGFSLDYTLDGVVLPAWLLALLCAVLPAFWVGRRLWRRRPEPPDELADVDSRSW